MWILILVFIDYKEKVKTEIKLKNNWFFLLSHHHKIVQTIIFHFSWIGWMSRNYSSVDEYIDNFELIPGETYFTGSIFIGASIVLFLTSLYFLSKYMQPRKPFKLKWVAFCHKFFNCILYFYTYILFSILLSIISFITAYGILKEVFFITIYCICYFFVYLIFIFNFVFYKLIRLSSNEFKEHVFYNMSYYYFFF
jgi:hypothetical protein